MPKQFLLVQLVSDNGVDMAHFTKTLDKALDWVQFASNGWLLWTSRDSSAWYDRLRPSLGESYNVLIVEANMKARAGRMPASFWEFVRSKDSE